MASISYPPPTMRRVAFLLAPVVLLCACSLLQKRVTYHMTFNVESDPIREELIWSSLRLMEDTATRLKTTIADKEVQTGSGSASITITLPTTKTADAMTEQLTAPFTLRFMKEVKENPATRRIRFRKPSIFFLQLGFCAKLKSLRVIEMMRQVRIPLYQALNRDKLLSQISSAENLRIPYSIILGQREALENSVIVRNTSSRAQETIKLKDLTEYFKKMKLG